MSSLNVGVYQDCHHSGGWEAGLVMLTRVLAEAAESSLDLVLFPELYLTGYAIGKESLAQNAITRDGTVMNKMRNVAKDYMIGFAIGYPERDSSDQNIIYNSLCVIDSRGNVVLNYRKSHLYDPSMEYEKVIFTAGSDFPVAEIYFPRINEFVTIGALICFDIEFPEPARILALQGASIILVSTADTENETLTPQKTIPCRAAENNVFIMYSNYVGPCTCFSEQGIEFHGQSGVFAPDGSMLGRFESGKVTGSISTGLLVTCLNRTIYNEHKRKNNYLRERRPDIYSHLLALEESCQSNNK
jgi:predicted amidohydrolase